MKATRILVLAACVLVTTDALQAQGQEGWSDRSIAGATEDCTRRTVAAANEGIARRGAISSAAKAAIQGEMAAICDCIVRKAAARWPLAEWQANFQARFESMFREAIAGGHCKPRTGLLGEAAKQYEGGTSRSMQEDFDRIRLDHAFVIGALLDEYSAKAGVYPFADGTDTLPAVVIIGTEDQAQRNKEFIRIGVDLELRATDGVPAPRIERVEFHTMSEFEAELGRVLGRSVRVPVDPQQVPVNKPSVYVYVLHRSIYDVSVFLHQEFSFARPLGPYYNKVAIASRSYPRRGVWTAEELKKESQFIEFFRKPFNSEGYTLRTKL